MTMMTNSILSITAKATTQAKAGAETALEGQPFDLTGETGGGFASLIAALVGPDSKPGKETAGKSATDAGDSKADDAPAPSIDTSLLATSAPVAMPVVVAAPVSVIVPQPQASGDTPRNGTDATASIFGTTSAALATTVQTTAPQAPSADAKPVTAFAGQTARVDQQSAEPIALPERAQSDTAQPVVAVPSTPVAPARRAAKAEPVLSTTIETVSASTPETNITTAAAQAGAPAAPTSAAATISSATPVTSARASKTAAVQAAPAQGVTVQAVATQIVTTGAEAEAVSTATPQAPVTTVMAGPEPQPKRTGDAAAGTESAPDTKKTGQLPATKTAPSLSAPAFLEALLGKRTSVTLGTQVSTAGSTSPLVDEETAPTVTTAVSTATTATASAATTTTSIAAPAITPEATASGLAATLPIVLGSGPRSAEAAPENGIKGKGGTAPAKSGAEVILADTMTPVTAMQSRNPARSGNEREDTSERGSRSDRQVSDTGFAAISQPAREIVQSLPPMVQAQIGLAPDRGALTLQPANTAQALGAEVIDMGVSGQWIDRVASEISTLAQGTGQSRFTLMPPHLGRIEISLAQAENGTNVHFATETDEATDRIRAAQVSLQSDSRLSGLSIGTITVEKSQQSFDQATRDSSQWAQGNRQGAESGAQSQSQSQAQAQSGGQGFSSREGKALSRDAVHHLAETSEGVGSPMSTDNPGVRFA